MSNTHSLSIRQFCLTLLVLLSFVISGCSTVEHLNEKEKQTYAEFRVSQESFLSSDGKISYVDVGESDKVILLLHGVPSSSWLYRKMFDDLVDDGYRVIAPDMLGFGNSDSPDGYDVYAPEQHAKRILELMESLDIDTWTHVMHDAGGVWTWALVDQKRPKTKSQNIGDWLKLSFYLTLINVTATEGVNLHVVPPPTMTK